MGPSDHLSSTAQEEGNDDGAHSHQEAEQKGEDAVMVKNVLEKSPADKAGIKAGDRITKVKGRTVENIDDVERFVKKLRADEVVALTVLRDKETKVIRFSTGEGL